MKKTNYTTPKMGIENVSVGTYLCASHEGNAAGVLKRKEVDLSIFVH